MTFDALAMHAVRDELEATIVGGQVQQVSLLGTHGLGLGIYAHHLRRYVLLSTGPGEARLHLVTAPLKRDTDAITPLLLLLRKHVRDGRVEAVEQPRLERLLTLHIVKRGDDGATHQVRLIIEAMGRRSNAVLVDEDGTILDAFKRLAPSRNPSRPLLPHIRYTPPPAQTRLDPLSDSTVSRLRDEVIAAPTTPRLADLFAQRLAGFSPQVAREVAWRVTGEPQALASAATDWLRLRAALDELLQPLQDGRWEPTIAWRDGQPVAAAPYPLTHLQGVELRSTASMSEALEQVAASAAQAPVRTSVPGAEFGQPAANIQRQLDRRREQLEHKQAALERSLPQPATVEALREAGEAILANASSIVAKQETLTWEGRSIPLDPTLGGVKNAQRYFKEYRKARDALRQVPAMLDQVSMERAYLDEMATFLATAGDAAHLRALKAELTEAGVLGAPPGQAGKGKTRPAAGKQRHDRPAARPRKVATTEGFELLVGTSAKCNDTITFDLAEAHDIWLHARGVPGAHVLIRSQGRPVPDDVLRQAAHLAATHSAAARADKVEVDWTERRRVRKQRGGRPGQVTYSQERTLVVRGSGAGGRGAEGRDQ